MLQRILASSRYIILIPVIGAFLSALATLVYGGIAVFWIFGLAFAQGNFTPSGVKLFAVDSIGLIDLFLLGTVLYIVALGLYGLFIDDQLSVPPWLHFTSLEELKEKLIGVIVVLLGVAFLGQVVEWKGDTSIWGLGVSIALVIAALSLLVLFGKHDTHDSGADHTHEV